MNEDLSVFGGKLMAYSVTGNPIWNFGWIPPSQRTPEQEEEHNKNISEMPKFQIVGDYNTDTDKAFLWQFSKQVNNGNHFLVFRQVTGSCFPAGTSVLMSDGSEKNIEDIQLDDEVISHTGTKRKVISLFYKNYTGKMYTFHLKGYRFPITATADHNMLIVDKKGNGIRWKPGEIIRKKAENVTLDDRMILSYGLRDNQEITLDLKDYINDCVFSDDKVFLKTKSKNSKSCNRFIKVDEDFAWLMGIFLAEGSNTSSSILFSLNSKETYFADRIIQIIRNKFDIESRTKNPKKSVLQVVVGSSIISKFFQSLVPNKVWTKRIPTLFFKTSENIKIALLRGWMDGDGHFQIRQIKNKLNTKINHGFCLRGVSASSGLIKDFARICLSCGMEIKALRRKKYSHQRVASMDLYLTGLNALRVYPEKEAEIRKLGINPQVANGSKLEYGFATKVEKIEINEVKDLPVYCCEVEVDHSLIIDSVGNGQCVGNGLGQAIWYLSAVEAAKGMPVEPKLPFYLLPYGRSRYYMQGGCGQGEGSFGSAAARAAKEDGILPFDYPGLPQPNMDDGISWGSRAEMTWSDGCYPSREQLAEAKKFTVKSTAQVKSADDVKAALINGYPCTIASDWGGQMSPSTQGDPPVLLNRRVTTWINDVSPQSVMAV